MGLRFRQVSPAEVRAPAVEFFWRMQAWPYSTKEEYFRYWDWRYSSLSEDEPIVWIAADGDKIVGHMALYFRRNRLDGQNVRVGVPGNFLVDDAYRDPMIGARLGSSPRSLVRDGVIDMLLSYGNRIAHGMFIRLGARDLGAMQPFVDVRRWGPVLGRRVRGASILAPLANAFVGARKALLRRGFARGDPKLEARELSIDDLLSVDRSHWRGSNDDFMADGSAKYLANRFLRCPVRTYHVYGIQDTRDGRLEGLVIAEGTIRVKIWECEVNAGRISETQAIEVALATMRGVESVVVPLLPESTLATDFDRAGYVRRPSIEHIEVDTSWSAYWRPQHPLASRFADTKRWKLWYGWNHN